MRHRIVNVLAAGAAAACLATGAAATANAAVGADRGEPVVVVCDTGVLGTGLLGSDGSLITDCGLVPDLLGGLGLG
ncbi:hypothetical protein C8D87_103640 [Lentzea atacamensis]|uniref:Uncharacterized protein n=1 Tax=Lentzea atacamensis TaxID=531938 RepID=A0ABX9EAV2_9PSEU|nr:hypothetical protein [Lentzea atacamensis]RAS67301.1 hypothetical protein C8D87_103640 [Lentzea atacamensis]